MEDGAVVQRSLFLLPVARVGPFASAFRKLDEVLHRDGCVLLEKADDDACLHWFERRISAGFTGHEGPFIRCGDAIKGRTSIVAERKRAVG